MVRYFERIDHVNSSDEPEEVITVTSSSEAPKTVERLLITSETNGGILEVNIEQETPIEYQTANATIQNFLEIPVEAELPVGQAVEVTLENVSAGVNAEVHGIIEYSIRG